MSNSFKGLLSVFSIISILVSSTASQAVMAEQESKKDPKPFANTAETKTILAKPGFEVSDIKKDPKPGFDVSDVKKDPKLKPQVIYSVPASQGNNPNPNIKKGKGK